MVIRDVNGEMVEGHPHSNGGGFVAETAHVDDTAYVGSEAEVYGKAWVSGEARVYGKAWVSGEAEVSGKAWVSGEARVSGEAEVSGKTKIPDGFNGATFSCNSWTATVNEDFVQIGCHAKPVREWLSLTPEEALEMGLPKEFYKPYKAFLEMVLVAMEI